MGSGSWSVNTYDTRTTFRAAAGIPTFDYDASLASVPRSSWTVHEALDPSKLNGAGNNVREALDSDEHPDSTAIAVIFDVTGSMRGIPRVLQEKLPALHGLLQRKGYVEDPQILFGAVGDAYSDTIPLQVGQFESDNRMDEQLEKLVLEGGGGGGNHESYQLAAYYLARHADLDSVTKRGKKGYCFFIGDERLYSTVDRRQVEQLIGDTLQENLTTEQIFAELKEKFEVFFLFAAQGSYGAEGRNVLFKDDGAGTTNLGYYDYGDNGNVCYWRDLLGQNALVLSDANAICETIALTIGLMEGTVDLSEGLDDLKAIGADLSTIKATGKALATVGASTGGAVATTEGDLPALSDEGGAERL